MRVLQVSAEIFPLLKTGGLADVAGALPSALRLAGCDVRVLLPGFPAILHNFVLERVVGEIRMPWGEPVAVAYGHLPLADGAVPAYVLQASGLYERPGGPYEDVQKRPYADNHRRFAALGWVAAHLGHGMDSAWAADVVHAHDWHAGLAPACLRWYPGAQQRRVVSVYTVHNLAYQGGFDASLFGDLGLPAEAFRMEGLEFHGQVSFMKAGLYYAQAITTVSPSYAREIQTPEQGCGLDGLLRARRDHLFGILNGVDDATWSPARDAGIAQSFDSRHLTGKAVCKAALQRECGLDIQADAPLFAMVSRMTEQKGLPLVLSAIGALVGQGGQLVLLGSGDTELEQACVHMARQHTGRVAVRIGYDEGFAHRIFAGSDVTLVPSLFEPCGLTQMYGLKYGSLPLVRAVGGLADTVVDADLATLEDRTANGFVFHPFTQAAFQHAVRRAMALYRNRTGWARVRQTAMRQALGWDRAASAYVDIYRALIVH